MFSMQPTISRPMGPTALVKGNDSDNTRRNYFVPVSFGYSADLSPYPYHTETPPTSRHYDPLYAESVALNDCVLFTTKYKSTDEN